MKRAMALATRVKCDKESDGFGDKSNGNKGGRQLTATRVMVTVTVMTWVMATVTRLAGDEEGQGEGARAMRTVMRVVGDKEATAMAARRAMATATMVAGEQWRWRRIG
jgi:hypothetical protein